MSGFVSLLLLGNLENLLQVFLLFHILGVILVVEPIVHAFHGGLFQLLDGNAEVCKTLELLLVGQNDQRKNVG